MKTTINRLARRKNMASDSNIGSVEKGGIVRVQFEIPAAKLEQMDSLLEPTGCRTRKELFNLGMTVVDWIVKEKDAGRIIASIDERSKVFKELCIPGLTC